MMEGYREICFIDTNIFLRLMLEDDKKSHEECAQFFAYLKAHDEVVPHTASIVFAEFYWVVAKIYAIPKEQCIGYMKIMSGMDRLVYEEAVDMRVALSLFSVHNVKFADCIIASHPLLQSGKMTIVSYDKDFDKLGVKRMEPKDIL